MSQLDPRILRVGVEVDGRLNVYEGLELECNITKTDNPLQNEATVKITNLKRDVRNWLLTETSPFNKNRTPKRVVVEAGRQSTGTFVVFSGDITESSPTQPPDIAINLKAKTGQYDKGNVIAVSHGAQTLLSVIAQGVAKSMGLTLLFQAADRQIANFSFTGAALKQVEKLAEAGRVNAFVDDKTLVVKDASKSLSTASHVLSAETGMIGIPEATEQGVKVTYLLDPASQIGGRLELSSQINPSLTGRYTIYKLTYALASRATQFYTIAEAKREGQ